MITYRELVLKKEAEKETEMKKKHIGYCTYVRSSKYCNAYYSICKRKTE